MTDHPLIYNKLVRDLIPEQITRSGKHASIGTLNTEQFLQALRLKLLEEAHELFHADTRADIINESADLLELIDTLLKHQDIDLKEVLQRKEEKRNSAGGFDKQLFLIATSTQAEHLTALHHPLNLQNSQTNKTHQSNQSGNLQTNTHLYTQNQPPQPLNNQLQEPRLPQLLTFNSLTGLVDIIKRELEDATTLSIASAFYGRGMLNLLLDPFLKFVQRGGQLRLLTSIMGNFNNPNDLKHLSEQIPNLPIRIFYPLDEHGHADFTQAPPPFHVKSFLFEKATGQHALIVGSSNLTGSGLARNHEWNYFSNSEANLALNNKLSAFQYAQQEYNHYWQDTSIPVDQGFIDAYLPRWQKAQQLRRDVAQAMDDSFQSPLSPRPAQIQALHALAERRAQGINKTTVIAATGLGKTYLAAFDFKQSGLKRILFIAHRENILIKALETFREVMADPHFGALLSATHKAAHTATSVFAMVQTLSQANTLDQYKDDAFDYLVIDEFHHAEANSYQRLLNKFKPQFLLGLTATPERMDGRDVLKLCDYNVAFETRLFDAINNHWLVPFQYFAIHDPSDYQALRWTQRGYIDAELDHVLINDTRAALIFNNLVKFLPATGKIKALAFCSTQQHAEYMSAQFNQLGASRGIQSVCLLGKDSIECREVAIQQLQEETHPLQIICSVDIFGEGIDIPAVSHVLFLRPTQSFTVFLQQLGRGLRQLPDKDYLVALDFVGNFKQSYVAHLAINGYTSVEDFKRHTRQHTQAKQLPSACYVNADTDVQRIWDADIKCILTPANKIVVLKALYQELRNNLDRSPQLMDFFVNPTSPDPSVFIKEKKLGGNWLRVKDFMHDLSAYETSLLDSPAEALLQHIEKELSPTKSYKMVVLKTLLTLKGTTWKVADIAHPFLNDYLTHPDHLADWDELAKTVEPEQFSLIKVEAHLMRMPLDKMANTGGEFFQLDKALKQFSVQETYQALWEDAEFKALLADRIDFALARYFYRRDKGASLVDKMKGFAVEVAYVSKPETGYTAEMREVIKKDPEANEWTFEFDKKGYSGTMDLEIQKGDKFIAWTKIEYKDISRFPARIKAAASALYCEGLRGGFRVVTEGVKIVVGRGNA